MTKIFSLILCLFSLTQSYAGWYECYTYKGTIGTMPITLSIQIKDGFFGEKGKKDFNSVGVYKYDKYNTPIRLEGKIDSKDTKAVLYEISNEKHSATFEFTFSKKTCKGVWKNLATGTTLPLQLTYVSQLVDTLGNVTIDNVEILQANSLQNYYFIGIYSEGEDRAQMNRLKIISKKDNIVFQVIDFSQVETATGNVKTIIYDNVEIANEKTMTFLVWNNIGRMGGYLTITFNSKTQKFKLDPNPEIDGPN